jgi:hypothetical protein
MVRRKYHYNIASENMVFSVITNKGFFKRLARSRAEIRGSIAGYGKKKKKERRCYRSILLFKPLNISIIIL